MDTLNKWLTSWGVIILALILFWPLSLVLLYLRFTKDKNVKPKLTGMVMLLCGIFSILFSLVGISTEISEPGEDLAIGIILILFFFIGGSLLVFFGIKKIILGNKYIKCASYINYSGITSLYDISAKMNEDMEKVNIYIAKCIELGLVNGYIDFENKMVVLKNQFTHMENDDKERKEIIITCKNCGASNQLLEGKTKQCEYCGSILKV